MIVLIHESILIHENHDKWLNTSTKNVLFEKMKIFSHIGERFRDLGTFSELMMIGAFCRCAMAEKRIHQHIFFCYFLTP